MSEILNWLGVLEYVVRIFKLKLDRVLMHACESTGVLEKYVLVTPTARVLYMTDATQTILL